MECGAEIQKSFGGVKKSYNAVGKPGKRLKWIIPLAAVLIVVIIVIFAATGSKGYKGSKRYKKPIDLYFKAIETQDIKYLYKVYPKYWQDGYIDIFGEEGLEWAFEDDIEYVLDEFGCGDKVKIISVISKVKKVSRSELDNLYLYGFLLEEYYGRDYIDKLIKEAVTVDVSYIVIGSEGIGSCKEAWLVVKEKGDWKINRLGVTIVTDSLYYSFTKTKWWIVIIYFVVLCVIALIVVGIVRWKRKKRAAKEQARLEAEQAMKEQEQNADESVERENSGNRSQWDCDEEPEEEEPEESENVLP